MELENRIIAVIAEKHPVNSCDIYAAVGGSKIQYNPAIKAQIKTGRIDREKQHYFPAEDPATTSPKYVAHAVAAEGLEKSSSGTVQPLNGWPLLIRATVITCARSLPGTGKNA